MIKKTTAATLLDGTKGANSVLDSTDYIEEIAIDSIDEDKENEYLFGYNEVSEIAKSINEIGFKSVVTVYKKENGRYQCLSGNSRIRAAKEIGMKKIPCQIEAEPANEDEKDLTLIRLNTQRHDRPLYKSRQLKRAEEIYRNQGFKGKELEDKLCDSFSLKRSEMYDTKKICTMHPKIQPLFAMDDIPHSALNRIATDITDYQAENLYAKMMAIYNIKGKVSTQETEAILREVMTDVPTPKEVEVIEKIEDSFKTLKKMKKYNINGPINISEKNKKEAKEIAEAYINYFQRILEACK